MVTKVEKWLADCGGEFDTREEAKAHEMIEMISVAVGGYADDRSAIRNALNWMLENGWTITPPPSCDKSI